MRSEHRGSSAAQLDREIAEALRAYDGRRRQRRHHSTALAEASQREPTADELYAVTYDVLREYEQHKKLGQEKSSEAQELIKRFHRIIKETREKYPDATPPATFTKLYDKLTKPDKTYTQAQRDILENLAANGWQVSAALKIPHATSPNGRLRLWFKPQAVWYTKLKPGERERHNFKDARTISYDLDIRRKDPDALRDWMVRSSEKGGD